MIGICILTTIAVLAWTTRPRPKYTIFEGWNVRRGIEGDLLREGWGGLT